MTPIVQLIFARLLSDAISFLDAERVMITVSRERLDDPAWRRDQLSVSTLEAHGGLVHYPAHRPPPTALRPRPASDRAPSPQGAARDTHIRGHAALRLPFRQPCLGRRDGLGLLQACASRHAPIPRPDLEPPGRVGRARARGVKLNTRGSSNTFPTPR
jgi:hypothetical protein